MPNLDQTTPPDAATVTVTGTGRVSRAADIARATFVVEATRDTAAAARAAAAEAAEATIDAIVAAGVARRDLRTAALDVQPNWEHDGTRSVRAGFTVTNRIGAVVRDLERVGEVLDAGLSAGATGLEGVAFELADSSADETEARRLAVLDARARAATIADAAGRPLGALVAVAEGSMPPIPAPRRERMMLAADQLGAPTPVMPGAAEVTVSVTAVWQLD